MKKQKKEKPLKHRMKRSTYTPGKPETFLAVCGFTVSGSWESKEVRAVMTISGKVTCQNCMKV